MADDSHLAIGDVLELLKAEFPDIKISKIRFLESQGLISPERTPSGYRKFYRDDVLRLQWILRQQRDHFLPLKVIRDRLDSGRLDLDELDEPARQPELWDHGAAGSMDAVGSAEAVESAPGAGAAAPSRASKPTESSVVAEIASASVAAEAGESRETAETPSDTSAAAASGDRGSDTIHRDGQADRGSEGLDVPMEVDGTRPLPHGGKMAPTPSQGSTEEESMGEEQASADGTGSAGSDAEPSASCQRAELCMRADIDDRLLTELERFGLVTASEDGTFPASAVEIARLGGLFASEGLEPRHLRMFSMAAERESSTYAQLVTPILRQRDEATRDAARRRVVRLADLGDQLRRELVRSLLDGLAGSP